MLPILLLLFTLISLTAAQAHGSPNGGAPVPVDPNAPQGAPVPLPTDPPSAPTPTLDAVSPTLDPNGIQWASWVDPNQLSPPTREPESTPGDLYVCTDINFSGTCSYFHALTYNCYNFDAPFRRQISSIRPDKNQVCIFYENEDCGGSDDWVRWPGSANMRGRRFDNRAASWRCSDDNCDGVQKKGGCTKNEDGSLKVKDQNGDNAKGWLRPTV